MAVINLTAKQYKSGLKWALVPANKVDTVQLQPISNAQADVDESIHTESFSDAYIFDQDTPTTLPISEDQPPTYWRHIHNERHVSFADREFAKARVECVMAAGTRVITIDKALLEIPTVKLQFTGKSYELGRGGSTYDTYPTYEELKDKSFNLTSWVKSHASSNNQFLIWDYEGSTFSMNPFVRNWVADDIPEDWKDGGQIPTTPNDILTTWYNFTLHEEQATKFAWSEETFFGAPKAKRMMLPVCSYTGDDISLVVSFALYMYDQRVNMYVGIRKLSDYTYQVNWSAPVRFTYAAATRSHILAEYHEMDNWAFVDEVTDISVVVQGQPLSDETINVNFSLTQDGDLTDKISNRHPLMVDKSEGFTLGTTYDSTPWTEKLAQELLKKYEDGKYIVECDVSATWALNNDIKIGTEMYITMLDGKQIQRNNSACLFSVKNIEKQFNNNEFIYRLKLMEV